MKELAYLVSSEHQTLQMNVSLYPHMAWAEREASSLKSLLIRSQPYSRGLLSYYLITSQRPHLLMSHHLRSYNFNIWMLRGDKYSATVVTLFLCQANGRFRWWNRHGKINEFLEPWIWRLLAFGNTYHFGGYLCIAPTFFFSLQVILLDKCTYFSTLP